MTSHNPDAPVTCQMLDDANAAVRRNPAGVMLAKAARAADKMEIPTNLSYPFLQAVEVERERQFQALTTFLLDHTRLGFGRGQALACARMIMKSVSPL